MTVQALLDALVRRPADAPATQPPGLLDHVAALKDARVWEGEWDTLKGPTRVSLPTPAALVSLVELEVVHLGHTLATSPGLAPAARAAEDLPRPQVAAEIGVTFVDAGGGADKRAQSLVGLAEAALPLLVAHGLTGLRASNLTSDNLRKRGMSAFAVVGMREFEIVPAGEAPARTLPQRVDVARELGTSTIYPAAEC